MATNTTATATPLAQAAPIVAPKSLSLTQDAWRRFIRNKAALSGLIFVGIIVVAAIFAPLIAPYHYATQDIRATTEGVGSSGHLLGTDRLGRDILSRIIYGTRISLAVGLVVPLMILLLGVPVGLVAGYKGGWVDTLSMRVVDVFYAIPNLLFIIIFMTYLKAKFLHITGGWLLPLKDFDTATGGMLGVFIGLGIFSWLTVSRLVRGQVLSLKRKEFVEAAHCMGASSGRIITRHLLPNTLAVIIVAATLGIPAAILGEAGISFIGLGINPPVPSWGLMISEGITDLRSYPYMLISPAVVLSLTVLSFNFIGDGLRDAFDPWMKK
ncbi:MAG: ABC transporter permease [Thermomicrobiales bacterium]